VLVPALMGDHPGAVSSTLPHRSDHGMIVAMIPVIPPAEVGGYPRFGTLGRERSRASVVPVEAKGPTVTW
jgi:indolepyruvate ferredoxin oxidoreductase